MNWWTGEGDVEIQAYKNRRPVGFGSYQENGVHTGEVNPWIFPPYIWFQMQ